MEALAVEDALFAAAAILALLTEFRLEDLELALELALDFCGTFDVARKPTLLIESSGSRYDRLVTLDGCLNFSVQSSIILLESLAGSFVTS